MKRSHIIAVVIIAIAVGAIISTISDSSTYASFSEAFSMQGKEFHVAGKYDREKEAAYKPETDPNLFVFYMTDREGAEKKVFLHRGKPQDFEMSEQIVVIGKAVEGEFHAKEILMKCPSKYVDGKGPTPPSP